MTKRIISNLLNSYLGQFVEGLAGDDLSVALWSGDVKLERLKIKTSALDFLHLPIAVKSGYVEKVHVHADWSSLGSQPVTINLQRVVIVAGPRTSFTVDEKAERAASIVSKKQRLKSAEELKLSLGKEGEKSEGFVQRLTEKIIDNVQLTITGIHIRYEDPDNLPRGFSFGIGLDQLTAYTTGADFGERKFVTSSSKVFKKVQLTGLCIYLNTDDPPLSKPCSIADRIDELKTLYDSDRRQAGALARAPKYDGKGFQYLLEPVNASLELAINKLDLPAPKYKAEFLVESLAFNIGEDQWPPVLSLLSTVTNATARIAELDNKLQSQFKAGTEVQRLRYISLYKRTLNADWLPVITDAERMEMDTLEDDLIYDDIARYRALAITELTRELKGKPVTLRVKPQVRRGLFGWGASTSVPIAAGVPDVIISDEERNAIFKDMDFDPNEDKKERKPLPRDYVKMEIDLVLSRSSLALYSERRAGVPARPLLLLQGKETQIRFMTRPVANNWLTAFALESWELVDSITPNTLFPRIIERSPTVPDPNSPSASTIAVATTSEPAALPPLLEGMLEMNPLDGSADLRVVAKLRPLDIVVSRDVIDRIRTFFIPKKQIDLKAFQTATVGAVNQAAIATRKNLAEAVTAHKTINLNVSIAAPTVIIPEDCGRRTANMLVLDLGRFQISTQLQSREERAATKRRLIGMTTDELDRLRTEPSESHYATLYDTFKLHGSHVAVFILTGGPEWRTQLNAAAAMPSTPVIPSATTGETKTPLLLPSPASSPASAATASSSSTTVDNSGDTPTHFLKPLDIDLVLRVSVASHINWLPSYRLSADLPAIDIQISAHSVGRLARLLRTITAPATDPLLVARRTSTAPLPITLATPTVPSPAVPPPASSPSSSGDASAATTEVAPSPLGTGVVELRCGHVLLQIANEWHGPVVLRGNEKRPPIIDMGLTDMTLRMADRRVDITLALLANHHAVQVPKPVAIVSPCVFQISGEYAVNKPTRPFVVEITATRAFDLMLSDRLAKDFSKTMHRWQPFFDFMKVAPIPIQDESTTAAAAVVPYDSKQIVDAPKPVGPTRAFDFSFHVPAINVSVAALQMAGTFLPVWQMEASKLTLGYGLGHYGTRASARLASLAAIDLRQQFADFKHILVSRAHDDDKPATVSGVSSSSVIIPDTKRAALDDTDHLVSMDWLSPPPLPLAAGASPQPQRAKLDVRFRNFDFQWNPNSMAALFVFLSPSPSHATAAATAPPPTTLSLTGSVLPSSSPSLSTQASERKRATPATPKYKWANKHDPSLYDTNVSIFIDRVSLTLNKDYETNPRHLVRFQLRDFRAEHYLCGPTFFTTGTVGNLQAQNMTPPPAGGPIVFSEVMGLPGYDGTTPLLSFRLESYNPSLENWPGHHLLIQVKMKSLRYVYIQPMVIEMVDYIMNGIVGAMVARRAAGGIAYALSPEEMRAAALALHFLSRSGERISVANPDQRFLKWDFEIDNPLVLIPRNDRSIECLYARLGSIVIKNWAAVNGDHIMDHMYINVKSMCMASAIKDDLDAFDTIPSSSTAPSSTASSAANSRQASVASTLNAPATLAASSSYSSASLFSTSSSSHDLHAMANLPLLETKSSLSSLPLSAGGMAATAAWSGDGFMGPAEARSVAESELPLILDQVNVDVCLQRPLDGDKWARDRPGAPGLRTSGQLSEVRFTFSSEQYAFVLGMSQENFAAFPYGSATPTMLPPPATPVAQAMGVTGSVTNPVTGASIPIPASASSSNLQALLAPPALDRGKSIGGGGGIVKYGLDDPEAKGGPLAADFALSKVQIRMVTRNRPATPPATSGTQEPSPKSGGSTSSDGLTTKVASSISLSSLADLMGHPPSPHTQTHATSAPPAIPRGPRYSPLSIIEVAHLKVDWARDIKGQHVTTVTLRSFSVDDQRDKARNSPFKKIISPYRDLMRTFDNQRAASHTTVSGDGKQPLPSAASSIIPASSSSSSSGTTIIAPGGAPVEEDPELMIRFTLTPPKVPGLGLAGQARKKLEIELQRPCGYAVPEFLVEVMAWFAAAQPPQYDQLPGSSDFNTHFKIKQSRFILLEEVNNRSARALVACFDINLKYHRTYDAPRGETFNVLTSTVTDMQVFASSADRPAVDGATTIIAPFGFNLDMHHKVADDSLQSPAYRMMSLALDPLEVRVSYEDIRIVLKVKDTFTRLRASMIPAKPATVVPPSTMNQPPAVVDTGMSSVTPATTPTAAAAAAANSGREEKDAIPSPASLTRADSHTGTTPKGTTVASPVTPVVKAEKKAPIVDLTITFTTASIILINDCSGRFLPLLNVRLLHGEKVQSYEERDGQASMLVSILIDCSWYNPKTIEWEALLHRVGISARGSTNGGPLQIAAESGDFDIRVTNTVVGVLLNTLQSWQADYRQPVRSQPFSPYYIRNETGIDLEYWIGDYPPTRVINATESSVGMEVFRSRDANLEAALNVSLRLDGLGTCHVQVGREGAKMTEIRGFDGLATPQVMVVHVEGRDGSKVVTLRSDLRIRNDTSIALEFAIAYSAATPYMLTLQRGEALSLPIWLRAWRTLQVRPVSLPYHASNPYPHSMMNDRGVAGSPLDHGHSLTCFAVDDQSGSLPMTFNLGLDRTRQEELLTVLRFAAPLQLWNLFAHAMDYSLVRERLYKQKLTHAPMMSGRLEPGEFVYIYQIDWTSLPGASRARGMIVDFANPDLAEDQYMLRFTIDGYETSKPIAMVGGLWAAKQFRTQTSVADRLAPVEFARPLSTSVSSNNNKGARVSTNAMSTTVSQPMLLTSLESTAGIGGSRVVSLFCDYWIINKSMHDLVYDSDQIRAYSRTRRVQMEGFPMITTRPHHHQQHDNKDKDHKDKSARLTLSLPGAEFLSDSCRVHVNRLKEGGDPDGAVTLFHQGGMRADLAVEFDPGSGPFYRTMHCTVGPRYVLINKSKRYLIAHQYGNRRDDITLLEPDKQVHYNWSDSSQTATRNGEPMMQISMEHWWRSTPFYINRIGELSTKLKRDVRPTTGDTNAATTSVTAEIVTFKVSVILQRATFVVLFHEEDPQHASYRIMNNSGYDITYQQLTGTPAPATQATVGPMVNNTLKNGDSIPFAWDDVTASPLTLRITVPSLPKHFDVPFDEIGYRKTLILKKYWQRLEGNGTRVGCGGHHLACATASNALWRSSAKDPHWKQLPGHGKMIDIGSDGDMWMLGVDNEIHRWNSLRDQWSLMEGQATCISVADRDHVIVVTQQHGDIWQLEGYLKWNRYPSILGGVQSASIGSDGELWAISKSNRIYRWATNTWQRMPGMALEVTVGSKDHIFVVTEWQQVFRWTCPPATKKIDETDWERIDGFVAHLACASDGSLLAAGPDTNLYYHQGVTRDDERKMRMDVHVNSDGVSKVLTLSMVDHKLQSGRSHLTKGADVKQEVAKVIVRATIPKIALLLIDDTKIPENRIVLTHLKNIRFGFGKHADYSEFEVRVGEIQMDNPHPDAHFPVVLWNKQDNRLPRANDKAPAAAVPFLRFQLVRRDDPAVSADGAPVSISIYEQLHIDLGQQASAQIEEKFLLHTLAFLQNAPRAAVNTIADVDDSPRVPWPQYLPESVQELLSLHAAPVVAVAVTNGSTDSKAVLAPSDINGIETKIAGLERRAIPLIGPVRPALSSGLQLEAQNMNRYDEQLQRPHYLYFKRFDINTIAVELSFAASATGSRHDSLIYKLASQSGRRGNVIKNLASIFLHIDKAAINLQPLNLRHANMTSTALSNTMSQHYTVTLTDQLPALLGSAQFLGNPAGFVNGIAKGMAGMVNRPVEVLTKGGDVAAVGVGMVEATGELIQSAVAGVGDTAGAITGTVGSGVAILARDKEFKRQRAKEMKDKPKNVLHGLWKGGKSVANGVFSGVTGVFVTPVLRAKEGGALGFVEGVGAGIVDLVAKPISGVVDAATHVTRGIAGTVETTGEVKRPILNARVANRKLENSYTIYSGPRRYVTLQNGGTAVVTSAGADPLAPSSAGGSSGAIGVRRSTSSSSLTRQHASSDASGVASHIAAATSSTPPVVSSMHHPSQPVRAASMANLHTTPTPTPVTTGGSGATVAAMGPAPINRSQTVYGPAVPAVSTTSSSTARVTSSSVSSPAVPPSVASSSGGGRPTATSYSATGGQISPAQQQVRALQLKSLQEVRQIAQQLGVDERGCKTKDDLVKKIVDRMMS